MGTRTAISKTARITRSKRVNPTVVEEKNEDNDDEEMMEAAVSFGSRSPVNEADTTTRERTAEPTSDAATELYDGASDEILEPTKVEMGELERAVKRLSAVMSKTDTGRGAPTSGRMKQLVKELQQLTTNRENPTRGAQDALLEGGRPRLARRTVYDDDDGEAPAPDDDEEGLYQGSGDDDGQPAITSARAWKRRSPQRHTHPRPQKRRTNKDKDAKQRPRRHGRKRTERNHQERRGWRWREQRQRPRRDAPDSNSSDGDGSSSDGDSSSDGWDPRGSSDGSPDGSSSSSESSTESDSEPSSAERETRRRARRSPSRARRNERRGRREQREYRKLRGRRDRRGLGRNPKARNIKDLELPSFTPTPRASVSTWVDRIDLPLKGAKESGRGEWSDRSLYFILGNKLMESAARWWVNMDRRLHRRDRTWTKLKVALLRRYGPRVDKSAAEARVNARFRLKNEPYADFAAGLREAADRNEVSERVFLAQFYRCLDRTVRQLVKQPPVPSTLEEAVEKAVEIDDPMDYMIMNQQATQNTHIPPLSGDGSRMMVIPGIGTLAIPTDGTENVEEGSVIPTGRPDAPAICTNQQGVYNWPAGVYEFPPGQKWNGRFWAAPGIAGKKRAEKKKTTSKTKPDAPPPKVKQTAKRAALESSSEDEVKERRTKRHKAP